MSRLHKRPKEKKEDKEPVITDVDEVEAVDTLSDPEDELEEIDEIDLAMQEFVAVCDQSINELNQKIENSQHDEVLKRSSAVLVDLKKDLGNYVDNAKIYRSKIIDYMDHGLSAKAAGELEEFLVATKALETRIETSLPSSIPRWKTNTANALKVIGIVLGFTLQVALVVGLAIATSGATGGLGLPLVIIIGLALLANQKDHVQKVIQNNGYGIKVATTAASYLFGATTAALIYENDDKKMKERFNLFREGSHTLTSKMRKSMLQAHDEKPDELKKTPRAEG